MNKDTRNRPRRFISTINCILELIFLSQCNPASGITAQSRQQNKKTMIEKRPNSKAQLCAKVSHPLISSRVLQCTYMVLQDNQ